LLDSAPRSDSGGPDQQDVVGLGGMRGGDQVVGAMRAA
jgi:hypothetical protein